MQRIVHIIKRSQLLLAALVLACGGRTSIQDYFGPPAPVGTASGGGDGAGGAFSCGPGTFVAGVGSECVACPPGTFSAGQPATSCAVWTECSWSEAEVQRPSSSQDRLCEATLGVRQFGTYEDDKALDVALDLDGNVYVSGNTYGSLDAPNAGDADAFLRKYGPSGTLLWAQQWGTPGPESARRLALGSDRVLVMVERWFSGLGEQTILRQVDAQGTALSEHLTSGGVDVAVTLQGDLFVGRSFERTVGDFDAVLDKLGSSAASIWGEAIATVAHEFSTAVAALPDGGVVVTGTTQGSLYRVLVEPEEAFVARLGSDGSLVWGVQFSGTGATHPRSVAVDSSGYAYVAGDVWFASGRSDGFVARVSPDGTLEWIREQGTDVQDEFMALAIDADDRVLVAGHTYETPYYVRDGIALRVFPTGELGSVQRFSGTLDEHVEGMAADPEGGVFIVGWTDGSIHGAPNLGGTEAFIVHLDGDSF